LWGCNGFLFRFAVVLVRSFVVVSIQLVVREKFVVIRRERRKPFAEVNISIRGCTIGRR